MVDVWARGQQVEWADHGCKVTVKREGDGEGKLRFGALANRSGGWRDPRVAGRTVVFQGT